MKKLILVSLLILMITSCSTKKDILYFQDSEALNGALIDIGYEPLVEPNDILNITLTALEDALLTPYRKNSNTDINNSGGDTSLRGFLVNVDGEINYPGLGNIKVGGLTRQEITQKIKDALAAYITAEIVVDVRITNFKITVIGEVNGPGVFQIPNERITLPEAIALAGDLSEDGNRNKIIVIREIDGKREVQHIDLTTTDIFNSTFYFLKQNDVVYVEPSLKGVKKSGFIPDVPAILSVATIILSAIIILTR